MANPRWAETSVPKYLPDRVAQLYYGHGLFCASHATFVIILTTVVILLCSYPLSNLPLPGNVPQSFTTHNPQANVTLPRWFYGSPKLYVQQVIVKSIVAPWNDDLLLTDAFRGPLAECFKVMEIIRNYQHSNGSFSLNNVCMHVENVRKKNNKMAAVLPEYNCLLLSPANLWQQDFNKFQMDSNLINTIYNYQNFVKGKISISEMLFGLSLKDAGVKRYPLRKKPRVMQFAVTVFMTQFQYLYLDGLQAYLKKLYPLTESANVSNSSNQSQIHIYYPEDVNYGELIPLSLTYFVLFLYIYFSMRKMEHIKSKICLAFGAFLTVLGSLSMTIGICFFFGLEFTGGRGHGKQVFPYLVIIVGLENVLVLVKSVMSTTSHLDVKIRLAQGLSREGWNITKNLLIEVTILTAGLLTFVPAIQEFCIFAIVGLLSDFYLQTVFFSTILSLNVECTEQTTYPHHSYYALNISNHQKSYFQNMDDCRRLPRSRSFPRLTGQNVVAPLLSSKIPVPKTMSKRVKVVHFWARTRFVQRSFMVGMVLWISVIVYNADSIQSFIRTTTTGEDEIVSSVDDEFKPTPETSAAWPPEQKSVITDVDLETKFLHDEHIMKMKVKDDSTHIDHSNKEFDWLKKADYDTRRRLSLNHWSSVLSLYNISLAGSYITILPAINVVHVVPPEIAQSLRNPNEKSIRFQWQSLAVALDPLDFPDVECTMRSAINEEGEERIRPFIPTSPMEIFMTALLCITSVFVVSYTFVVLYRCICSRNYAEWRSSWSNAGDSSSSRTQILREALPVAIEGHTHLIECVATDGNVIASTCLGGEVKIWDAITGESVVQIERNECKRKYDFSEGLRQVYDSDKSYPTQLESSVKCIPNGNVYNIYERGKRSHSNVKLDPGSTCTEMESESRDYGENVSSCGSCSPNVNSHHPRFVLDKRKEELSNCQSSTGNRNDHTDTIFYETNSRAYIPIWCIDCKDNLVVVGCVDGCLEFWDCVTGKLKCTFVEEENISITAVKLMDDRVLAAKLNGTLCFYKLNILTRLAGESQNRIATQRRVHVRSGSMDSMCWQNGSYEELRCFKTESAKAHSKPITVLETENGQVITGSEDRTLKVFQLENHSLKYTLHGHCGPITCVFIDRFNPIMAGSGSQDGLLCVWDLHTGACMYSIQAHDGSIFALVYSASYVISLGQDEKICVWDRFQGHLLNTIPVVDSYCTSLCMLTHNLLITSRQGCLVVLDAGTGETIRIVKLGSNNSCVFIRHILDVGDGVVCDYGDQLRLVRFPSVCDKSD